MGRLAAIAWFNKIWISEQLDLDNLNAHFLKSPSTHFQVSKILLITRVCETQSGKPLPLPFNTKQELNLTPLIYISTNCYSLTCF